MDRRRFLRWLGVGVAAGAAAPTVVASVASALPDSLCQYFQKS